uniref:ADP-ribosylation factor-like protein 2-binding protein n=1 Tax=Pan paniscus TaxID=9597 RepID=A0A2R8ZYP3_PANPA
MDTSEEESFVLSFSSTSDEFAVVVGYLENVIMDKEFQLLQRNFMDKYYLDHRTQPAYIFLVEKYIEEQLLERISGFNMAAFTTTLQHHKNEAAGDIFDMLAAKEGRGLDLSSGLVVTSLCQSSSVPASQNNLRHWVLLPANELEHSGCHQPNRLSS